MILFNLWMAVACGYALLRGGGPERVTAIAFLVGVAATIAAQSKLAGRFQSVETGILLVDILFLAVILIVALKANRFWPLWVVALQILTVSAHGVKAYMPHLDAWMYHAVVSRLGWVILLLLTIGTYRHRQRLRRFGADASWSGSFARWRDAKPEISPTR